MVFRWVKKSSAQWLCSIFVFVLTGSVFAVDLDNLKKDLETKGVVGEIHGVSAVNDLRVFTFRNPQDFFDFVNLPILGQSPPVQAQIDGMKRHQKVRIRGKFIDNSAPINHILVARIELLADHESETDLYPFQPKTPISEVTSQQLLTGRVHVVGAAGDFFVVEYKDLILPVVVRAPAQQELVKKFFRGDFIQLRYRARSTPPRPVHLSPLTSGTGDQAPIRVLERIADCHDQQIVKTGSLVKFPKSPQILNDTFAVLQEDQGGSGVQFTLINFDNMSQNAELRTILQEAWVRAPNSRIENGRNKLIHRGIQIRASGKCNVVSPNQANPQILFSNVSDIEVTVL